MLHAGLAQLLIPAAVRNYVSSNIHHPVAAIGCRVSGDPLDCCEYDLAVFAEGINQVVEVAGHTVELVYFAGTASNYAVDLKGMTILRDTNKFALSSAAQEITAKRYNSALAALGRKSLVSSLFYQQKMEEAKKPTVAAMCLKMAAYEFVGGVLALSGNRPMPLHELAQVRQTEAAGGIAEGVGVALECIGIERATRPAISRSIGAVMELKSKEYDRELVLSKIKYLLDRRMLTDCYYYAGRVAAKNLAGRSEQFHSRYSKLVQLSMDLTSDLQHLQKLRRSLSRAARSGLK